MMGLGSSRNSLQSFQTLAGFSILPVGGVCLRLVGYDLGIDPHDNEKPHSLDRLWGFLVLR
jgi:hypothetical protein